MDESSAAQLAWMLVVWMVASSAGNLDESLVASRVDSMVASKDVRLDGLKEIEQVDKLDVHSAVPMGKQMAVSLGDN